MKNYYINFIFLILLFTACTQKPKENAKIELIQKNQNLLMITDETFIVAEDMRVFCVMAFINAIGYDQEFGDQMNTVRKTVRQLVNENLKSSRFDISKYKEIFKKQHINPYHFINYALCLTNDYPFKHIQENDELKSRKVFLNVYGNLPEILNDFYKNAKVDDIWKVVKPIYDEEINKYDISKMKNDLEGVWSYLKDERKDNYKLVLIPNLLDSHNSAMAFEYNNFYYSVQGIGTSAYGLNIHEYLHSYIDGLVDSNIDNYIAKFGLYYNVGKSMPIARNYQVFPDFVSECLVRALNNRIEKKDNSIMDKEMDGGLLLVKPFYLGLEKFEIQSLPFSDYIKILFDDISELY